MGSGAEGPDREEAERRIADVARTQSSFLDLSDLGLAVIPHSIGQLTALETLELRGNKHLISPPPEVQVQGVWAVRAFLRANAVSYVEHWRSKIVIVGEAMVGKTSPLVVATHGDEHSPATLPDDLPGRYPAFVAVHTVDSRTRLGIDELHASIARHAAALPLIGACWPAAWDAAARALGELPELTVTTSRAFRHLSEAGAPGPTAQQAIARTLHDLGQIAYFAAIPDLATKIILKPEWLDARITQVIDSQSVTDAGGVLSRAERSRIWTDLADAEDDPDLPDRLIRVMEAFDLAYRVGDADDSLDVALIVDRLPEAPRPASPASGTKRARREALASLGSSFSRSAVIMLF